MDTIHTIGRRKASVARIYLKKGKGAITINKKDYKDFFPVEGLQQRLLQPFSVLDFLEKMWQSLKKAPNFSIKHQPQKGPFLGQ